jgi:ribonucleoside-diphosphate reductase beta chain
MTIPAICVPSVHELPARGFLKYPESPFIKKDASPIQLFKFSKEDPLKTPIFFGENGSVPMSRSDIVRYPIFQKQAERMFASFWKPTEINLSKDKSDFLALDDFEQHLFMSNIRSQIAQDHIQSLGLVQAFMPITTDPMVKRCFNYIEFFEELHASAYEHIAKNVFNDPSVIFDGMGEVEEIVRRSSSVTKYYDLLLEEVAKYRLKQTSEYSVRRAAWMALQAINALEGIRFFVSFACSFSFGDSGRMVGNATEIKMIANDELLHVAFTTALLRILPEDYPEFAEIERECRAEAFALFMDVVAEEKFWNAYLFKKGSLIGLNQEILDQYLSFMAAKRMRAIGMEYPDEVPRTNPLPMMGRWLNEGDSQPAPQETEISGYVHRLNIDIDENSFDGFDL